MSKPPAHRMSPILLCPALVFSPFCCTFAAFVETGHRLVCTANLHLSKVCETALAVLVGAFDYQNVSDSTFFRFMSHSFCSVDILPAILTAENVFHCFPLHGLALIVFTIQDHLVGTGSTFKSLMAGRCVIRRRYMQLWQFRNGQHVATSWTDCRLISLMARAVINHQHNSMIGMARGQGFCSSCDYIDCVLWT